MTNELIKKIEYLKANNVVSNLGRKPIIFIDQDDVLAKHNDKVVKKINELKGTNFTLEDLNSWDLISTLGEECKDIMFKPKFFKDLEPMEYMIENLKMLVESDLFDIYIASAAHPQACWYKYDWIKQYIPFMKKDKLIFISHKYLLNGDLLFDDAPHNLLKFKGNVVCFDKKYNRNLTQFDRVKDWNEFSEYLINKFYTF